MPLIDATVNETLPLGNRSRPEFLHRVKLSSVTVIDSLLNAPQTA